MKNYKTMETCFLCGSEFQFGQHAYQGRHLQGYGIIVCDACYGSNSDGWNDHCGAKILASLKARGIEPPDANESGWLPRDWPGRKNQT